MKKKILSVIISVCMMFACISVLPQDLFPSGTGFIASAANSGRCGTNLYWTYKNGVMTISGSGTMYNYNYIQDSPFYKYKIKRIVVKNGVTSIGTLAFPSEDLVTVSLPSSIQTIGDRAFFGCSNMTTINIPDNVTYIGKEAFFCCTKLSKVNIPKALSKIEDSCFFACCNLKKVEIPYGVSEICNGAFGNCTQLNEITIPESVQSIGEHAFFTAGLKSVYIPKETSIGNEAFGYSMGGKITDLVIYCRKGSWAEIYAQNNDIKYKTINSTLYRLQGNNRYETAVEISKKYKSSDYVILASGLNSADALAGVPLADAYRAPVLLTAKNAITNSTLNEIKRLKAKTVIILGGTGAISKSVENKIKNLGVTTNRIGGKTRFATARLIAERLMSIKGYYPSEVFFVNYSSYADALSVSTVAAIKGAPILYVKKDGALDSDTTAYLKKVKSYLNNAYVIGGAGVISEKVRSSYIRNSIGKTPTRIYGSNRYDTCVAVNETFSSIFTDRVICVAKGLDFPDALSGGAIAAYVGSPLLLADSTLNSKQTKYLNKLKPNRIIVFGGHFAVTDGIVQKIRMASQGFINSTEQPVPDIIKSMLETTDPSYSGQPGGPAAAFMTYYGYLGHEGTMQDEMWFQDMNGDGKPDLVVGGYSVGGIPGMGQGQVHCFNVQINGGSACTIHLRPDYQNKSKHGHDAFVLQGYKDKNGNITFTHTQFYAYTSGDHPDPRYAGSFTWYEYNFKSNNPENDKRQLMLYYYDTRNGKGANAFTCYSASNQLISASQAKKIYNNYYNSKTPLKANIKTINYQDYMYNMTQEQRKKALMDSYYSFYYSEDTSIKPFAKEIFDLIP